MNKILVAIVAYDGMLKRYMGYSCHVQKVRNKDSKTCCRINICVNERKFPEKYMKKKSQLFIEEKPVAFPLKVQTKMKSVAVYVQVSVQETSCHLLGYISEVYMERTVATPLTYT